ncbi:MAG: single-stranded DNA-binding protein [Rickettsiales bacterium]
MNVFSATGNLGQDCKTNNVGGTAVCNFSVAVKAGYGDKAQTLWIDCALWGKQAESRLPDYLVKGQQVAVSGELSTREHDGKTYLQLRCNNVDLIGKRDDSVAPSSPAPQQQAASAPAAGNGPAPDFDDSDIPF